jgi:heme O synthase-like polyprenyltransferase
MYKDDYAQGGYAVLPTRDPTGQRTAITIAVWTWMLLLATIAPALYMPRSLGFVYIAIALMTGFGFAYLAFRLVRRLERKDAKILFFGSIIHLPVLMIAMVTEALIRVAVRAP